MGECLLSSTSDRFDNIEIQNEAFQLKLKAKDPSGIGASTHVKDTPSCPTNILRFLKSDDAHAAAVLRLSRTFSLYHVPSRDIKL